MDRKTDEQLNPHQELDALAQEVLRLSRDTLLVNLRFLDMALNRFQLTAKPEGGISTDGDHLFYDAKAVLRAYQEDEKLCTRNYLHMVFHCVFRHNFVSTLVDRLLWDLACDIAVEAAIVALGVPCVVSARQTAQLPVVQELQSHLKKLTADKIYNYYLDQTLPEDRIRYLSGLFHADDHDDWYLPPVIEFGHENSGGQGPGTGDEQSSGGSGGGEGNGQSEDGQDQPNEEGEISNETTQTGSDLDQISYNSA